MPTHRGTLLITAALICVAPLRAPAQVPVDASGEPFPVESGAVIEDPGPDGIPLASGAELDELVAPVALYPDPLLAVVLPAAAYPLQIVQAARFLEALEDDPTLTPPEDWDESVVALLNYPEVLADLNRDLDWTLRLGEAVIAQQGDVMAAVQRFRNRAYAAGNLESDPRQTVRRADDVIEIAPANEDIIYVPTYEPSAVVVASRRPVISYYPEPYPVYYYPYPDGHSFRSGFFWGVTTAYTLGWHQHRLRVMHHSFYGHPYYARDYGWRWWYRRPTLVYHNSIYFRDRARYRHYRGRVGDYWVPRPHYRPWRPARRDVPRARTRDGYADRYSDNRRSHTPSLTTRRDTAGVRPRNLSTNAYRSAPNRTQSRNETPRAAAPRVTTSPPAQRQRGQRATNSSPYTLSTRRDRSGDVRAPSPEGSVRRQQNRPSTATTRSTYRRNEPARQQRAAQPRSTEQRPARRQEAPARAPSRASRPAQQRDRSGSGDRRERSLQRRDR